MNTTNYKEKMNKREEAIRDQMLSNENTSWTVITNNNTKTTNLFPVSIPEKKILKIEKKYEQMKKKSEGKKSPPLTIPQIFIVIISISLMSLFINFISSLLVVDINNTIYPPTYHFHYPTTYQPPTPAEPSKFFWTVTIFLIIAALSLIATSIITIKALKSHNKDFISNPNNIYSHIYFITKKTKTITFARFHYLLHYRSYLSFRTTYGFIYLFSFSFVSLFFLI